MKFCARLSLSLSLVLVLAVVFGTWKANEDLYMSLCSGRDVLGGRLGAPDEWSFLTDGKVWIDQGWLSGLIYYVSYERFQELGPVLLKALLLVLLVPPLLLRCRRFGASWEIALAATALGILSIFPFVGIKAENFGLLYFVLLSALLSAPQTHGLMRQFLVALVMLLWVNSHASFLMGFGLIMIKVLLAGARFCAEVYYPNILQWPGTRVNNRYVESSVTHLDLDSAGVPRTRVDPIGTGSGEVVSWAVTALVCLLIIAFANPFGLANLMIPFRQIGSRAWTGNVPLWKPLLTIDAQSGMILSFKGSVWFLGLMLSICLALLSIVVLKGPKRFVSYLVDRAKSASSGLLMEVAMCCATLVLVLRHGRAISFAGLALVGITGFLFQSLYTSFREWLCHKLPQGGPTILSRIGVVVSLVALGASAYLFRIETMPMLLPVNPMVLDTSITRRIFSQMIHLDVLGKFLKNNGMPGRIFSPMMISDVLLFEFPEVQICIDSRAQSIYSAEFTVYDSLQFVHPENEESRSRAVSLLDSYDIRYAALTLHAYCGPLAKVLASSGKWLPIYSGPEGTIYVRQESEKLRSFFALGNLDHLWYPSEQSRSLSLAALSLLTTGKVTSEVQTALKKSLVKNPLNRAYEVLHDANLQPNGCLTENARSYLMSEVERLLATDYMKPDGSRSILGSLDILLRLLEHDDRRCQSRKVDGVFAAWQADLRSVASNMRREFLPRSLAY